MKTNVYDLMYAIGDVSDYVVMETSARSRQVKERAFVKWAALAACVCYFVIGSIYGMYRNSKAAFTGPFGPVIAGHTGIETSDTDNSGTAVPDTGIPDTAEPAPDETTTTPDRTLGYGDVVDVIDYNGIEVTLCEQHVADSTYYYALFDYGNTFYDLFSYGGFEQVYDLLHFVLGTEDAGYEDSHIAPVNILGHDITRVRVEYLFVFKYSYYDADHACIAEASTDTFDDFVAVSADVDGDGVDEFVASDDYADGAECVTVYRSTEEGIESGSLDVEYIRSLFDAEDEWNDRAFLETYDAEKNAFVVTYLRDDGAELTQEIYGLDHVDFHTYLKLYDDGNSVGYTYLESFSYRDIEMTKYIVGNGIYVIFCEYGGIRYEIDTESDHTATLHYVFGTAEAGYADAHLPPNQILGLDITRVFVSYGYRCSYYYYTQIGGKEVCVADAYTDMTDDFIYSAADVDGDGVKEFVTSQDYAYGAKYVAVYRICDAGIESGKISADYTKELFGLGDKWDDRGLDETYNVKKNAFIITYRSENGKEETKEIYGLDHFKFDMYASFDDIGQSGNDDKNNGNATNTSSNLHEYVFDYTALEAELTKIEKAKGPYYINGMDLELHATVYTNTYRDDAVLMLAHFEQWDNETGVLYMEGDLWFVVKLFINTGKYEIIEVLDGEPPVDNEYGFDMRGACNDMFYCYIEFCESDRYLLYSDRESSNLKLKDKKTGKITTVRDWKRKSDGATYGIDYSDGRTLGYDCGGGILFNDKYVFYTLSTPDWFTTWDKEITKTNYVYIIETGETREYLSGYSFSGFGGDTLYLKIIPESPDDYTQYYSVDLSHSLSENVRREEFISGFRHDPFVNNVQNMITKDGIFILFKQEAGSYVNPVTSGIYCYNTDTKTARMETPVKYDYYYGFSISEEANSYVGYNIVKESKDIRFCVFEYRGE